MLIINDERTEIVKLDEPMPTITSKNGFGVVTPYITQLGQTGRTADRNKPITEPISTVVTKAEHCLITPTLIQYHSETSENGVRGQDIQEPIMTIDGSPRYGLVSAFISQYFAGGYTGAGSNLDCPLPTITAVDHNALCTAHIIQMNNNMIGTDMREPVNTIVAGPGHIGEIRAFLIKYYQGTGRSLNEPLGAVVSKDRFGLVTIAGTQYVIVDIGWWMPFYQYDWVCSSKIFDFTQEDLYLPENTMKGGTGYDIKGKLPPEIDDMFPDYSIYPKCDYTIGFLTRGCPNHCDWCVVPEKEGDIKPYRTWEQIVRPDTSKLILMDNNILAIDHGIKQLIGLVNTGIRIDLNQGMDIRLVTEDMVEIFKDLKWIRFIRFSCDTKSQLPYFERVVGWFKKHNVGVSKMFIYTLIRKDLKEADYRVQNLNALDKNIHIYAQAERNEKKGIIPNKAQLEFAQRYVYGRLYRRENWKQYCMRKDLASTVSYDSLEQ